MLLFVTADSDVNVLGGVICTIVASNFGGGLVYDGIVVFVVVIDSDDIIGKAGCDNMESDTVFSSGFSVVNLAC